MEKKRKEIPKRLRTPLAIIMLLLWVAAVALSSEAAVFYSLYWIFGADAFDATWFVAIYHILTSALTLFVAVIIPHLFFKKGRTTREESGLTGLLTWTDIGLAPLGYVVSTILAIGASALFSLFPWFNANQGQDLGFATALTGMDRIMGFFAVAVVAPIIEEIVFRGWLYGKIRSRLNMVASILIVSLLFGLIHRQWNLGLNTFVTSIVLCGLREMTGTIYSGIIVHMIKNGIAFYLVYVMGVGMV
jgi:membrane protease YdiL (CAAX protease family)